MKKTLYPHELIGQEIEIINSTNESLIGIKGRVVNETKATLQVQEGDRVRMVIKSIVVMKLADGQIIEGKEIEGRGEERLKGK